MNGLAAVLAAATAVAVAVLALVALGHRPARTGVTSSHRVTQADVRQAATRALQLLQLPSGAVPSGLGRGTPGQLRSPSSRLGIPHGIDLYRVWRVRERPDRIIQFLESQFPGGTASGFGTEAGSSGPGGRTVIQQATGTLTLRVTDAGIWRQLALDAVALGGGWTALRVDSEAGWIRPRPASELIPRGVTRIVLSWATRSPRRRGSVTVTNPVRVKALVSAFNALPAGSGPCTKAPNGVLRFAFDAEGSESPLAIVIWAPPCRELGLTISGRPTLPLMTGAPTETYGGPFYAQIDELLLKIARPRRVSDSVTTVHSSGACAIHRLPTPASSPSAPGAAGGSCASGSRSTTSASAR
jgi:hypothetical protein